MVDDLHSVLVMPAIHAMCFKPAGALAEGLQAAHVAACEDCMGRDVVNLWFGAVGCAGS
jgi:hypothetical protein